MDTNAASPESPTQRAVEVDPKRLSESALNALVESFILREGTDYGPREVSLAGKKAQVMRLLQGGEAKIYFDLDHETCTLVPAFDAGASARAVPHSED